MRLPGFSFKTIVPESPELPLLKAHFDELQPIHGAQIATRKKIGKGDTHRYEVFLEGDEIKGLVVYKKELVRDDLALTALSLVKPVIDDRAGLDAMLIERALDIAATRQAGHVTVMVSSQSAALGFFQHHGFTEVANKAKNNNGATSYTLVRSVCSDSPILSCVLAPYHLWAMRSGTKTVDVRPNTPFSQQFKPGRLVEWFSDSDRVVTKINTHEKFSSFDDMTSHKGFKKVFPEASNFGEANELFDSKLGYAEQSKQQGVIALGITLFQPAQAQEGTRKRPREEESHSTSPAPLKRARQ